MKAVTLGQDPDNLKSCDDTENKKDHQFNKPNKLCKTVSGQMAVW